VHFGRVEKLNPFDPVLPPDTARTEKFLALPREAETKIYVGCPIWAAPAWVGDVYRKGTKPSDFLKNYSQVFDCVELNSSFYHMPDPRRIEQWRDETPPGFRFCPKVFRGITEQLGSAEMPALVEQYCETVLHFESRLGLTFAQFADWFGPQHFPLLEKFLTVWPAQVPLAVELRHPGWFRNHSLPDAIVNLFYKRHTASLITDTAGRRDVLHFSLTQPKVMIRFQGNEGDPLDEARIKEWGTRLRKWKAHSLEEIYFFAHQPSDTLIPSTARLAAWEINGAEIPVVEQPAQQLEML